jgi:hypothetical protein
MMKKQILKIVVLSLLSISISTTLKAQNYEGAPEEDYTDEKIEEGIHNSNPYELHWNVQSNTNNSYQNAEEGTPYSGSIVYPLGSRVSNENSGNAIGGIPDPPPDTPIDSNLYVLFFAALCYGVYQRKRLSSLVVSD